MLKTKHSVYVSSMKLNYIKNATAAQAKAVKVIHADHQFATTGTPIENRLSRAVGIFDYDAGSALQ